MAKRVLRLLPNPEHALDGEGKGACAVQQYASSGQLWVGARLEFVANKTTDGAAKTDGLVNVPEGRHVFVFDRERSFDVPMDRDFNEVAYYLRKLQDGELLPFDEETAKIAKVPFVSKSAPEKKSKPAKPSDAA